MTKPVVILVLILSVLGIGYFSYRLGILPLAPRPTSQTVALLKLENLPNRYCPKTAQVVIERSNRIVANAELAVANCRVIDLQSTLRSGGAGRASIKLPRAVAFSVDWPPEGEENFTYAPALGDANGDNSITDVDTRLVTDALFRAGNGSAVDVDGDGSVTVGDLTLVRLNQGVGVNRPDGQQWSGL